MANIRECTLLADIIIAYLFIGCQKKDLSKDKFFKIKLCFN